MVTAILAVAIARARRLLVDSVVESSAARELSKFVPDEVARQAKAGEEHMQAGQGEVREATILFTDIEGFTTISEAMTPTEALPDHAAQAIRAALAIQRALRDRRFGGGFVLRSRVGINSGEIVGGLVGTGDRLGYTVHGDDVNLAARLEQLNKDYETRIIVSQRTRELAGPSAFAFEQLGSTNVRGRKTPVVIYTVRGDSEGEQSG
jgi:adenylate cyclase